MKKVLLLITIMLTTISLSAQRDSTVYTGGANQRDIYKNASSIKINIFPVPVRKNNFTIRTDRDITLVKVTNIIGQDIYKKQYNDPLQSVDVLLDHPRRGMYLVTIIFSDGLRVVKKIMVEESE